MRNGEGRWVLLAALAWGCGSNSNVDSGGESADGSGAASSGSALGSGSAQGSGGNGGGTIAKECQLVDGQLSYGPIGEPISWPLDTVSTLIGDCGSCRTDMSTAFRTDSGYGFVWRIGDGAGRTLYAMNVDSGFQGGEPQAIGPEDPGYFDVVTAPGGFIVTSCTSDVPKWDQLSFDLTPVQPQELDAPDAPCGYLAPQVFWTGEVILATFTDARGLVVAAFNEQGVLVGEEILSPEIDVNVKTAYAKNDDRVLFAFNSTVGEPGRYSVLDLSGKPLGEVQTLGETTNNSGGEVAVVENGDGWWILNDSGSAGRDGALLTGIDGEGAVWHEEQFLQEFVSLTSLSRSPSGQTLFVGSWAETGLHAHTYPLIALINDAGEIVYYRESTPIDTIPWASDVVVDPARDLVIEERANEDSGRTTVIQEYGCLE